MSPEEKAARQDLSDALTALAAICEKASLRVHTSNIAMSGGTFETAHKNVVAAKIRLETIQEFGI